MSRKIYKHTFTITVLSEDAGLSEYDLDAIADGIDNGPDIGQFTHTNVVLVPPDKVKEELLLLGNDGEFFSSLDE